MRVAGKTFVVTGGGSGIGRAIVLGLVQRGATVAAADIRRTTLQETKKLARRKSDRMSTHLVNIANRGSVRKLRDVVLKKHGHVDGLINNAGIIQPFVTINELNFQAIDRVMQVNFYGMLHMTKAFLPHLLKRPEAYIANVSSMGGFLPVPGQSVYGASKAAVKLFTEGLSAELAGTHVHVSVIFPGATATNISTNSGVKAPSLSRADKQKKNFQALPAKDAAQVILDGIENNTVRIFVGKDSRLMNRLYRLSPGFATNLITKQMRALLGDMSKPGLHK